MRLFYRAGWTLFRQAGEVRYWTRPGKERGVSATTGYCRRQSDGADLLKVFTSNAPPLEPEKAYGKYRFFALHQAGGDWARAARALAAQGFKSRGHNANGQAAPGQSGGRNPAAPGFRYLPETSAQLYAHDRRPTWLVRGLLAAGQPAVIGAPFKTYKTTIAIDLAVSLASGSPFLGRFPTPRPHKVAILSGESGAWAIGETNKRICEARGLDAAAVDVAWMFDLPKLTSEADLSELCRGLKFAGVEVVIIDPLYLCLLGGSTEVKAENLYQIGPLLLNVARACLGAGATPILNHHATKGTTQKRDPLELGDLAYSGIAEFARQWLLLSWREPFSPSGPRKLWLAAGGSCGQGGHWAVDIDEGELGDDFTGRVWDVEVRPADEEREARKAQTEGERAAQRAHAEQADERKLIKILETAGATGMSRTTIAEAAGLSNDKAKVVLDRLVRREVVELIPGFTVASGKGARTSCKGYRLAVGDPF